MKAVERSTETVVAPALRPSRGGLLRRESTQAFAVLFVLVAIFLWKPLTQPSSYYAPTDVLQANAILRTAPSNYQVQNQNEYDPGDLFYPWLKWNKSSLGRFELPTWNPYNASGVPHLANYESAVFSFFSLPFYVLSFRVALLVAAFMKLFVAGMFTYMFLRRVRVGHLGALTASVIFMFSAYNVLWLNWTAAASAACLPVMLYVAELAIQARDARRFRLALAGLSLAIAASLLVGYAETTFFSLVLVLAWMAYRLVGRRPSFPRVLAITGATLLGVLLAAVQILPFAEYLGKSSYYALRVSTPPPTQDHRFIGLLAFPNLFGNPSQRYQDVAIPPTAGWNFNEVASIYVGLLALSLAALGLIAWRKKHPGLVGFFGVAALAWVVYAYNLVGLEHVVRLLPVLRTAIPGRSDPVWAFSIGCLAAAGVDRALDWSGAHRSMRYRLLPVGGFLMLSCGVLGWAFYEKHRLLDTFGHLPGSTLRSALARHAISDHVLYMSATYAAGVVALILLGLAGKKRVVRISAGALLIAMVFAQSGYMFRNYNPTISERYFYPVTPTLAALSARTGDAQTLRLDETAIPADSNLWYQVSTPVSYDAIGVKHYDDLYRELLRAPQSYNGFFEPPAGPRNLAGLQALGVHFVSSGNRYPFGTEATDPSLADQSGATSLNPSEPGQPVTQEFNSSASGLDLILVPVGGATPADCELSLTVDELPSARPVASSTAPCRAPEAAFAFTPLTDSAGKQYRVQITSNDARASLLQSPGLPSSPGHGSGLGPHLVMTAFSTDVPGLQPIENIGSLHLFAVPGTPPQYFSPGEARSMKGDSQTLDLLRGGSVDVNRTALLDLPDVSSEGSPGSVKVRRRSATEVSLSVTRDQPGWLVAIQTYYPGWTATVNGRRVPIRRADLAFSAVPVGRGTSAVVLRYQPASVSVGLTVSALALLALIALVISGIPWRSATIRRTNH